MLDWVIVGGGIHGTYASNHLLKAGRANPEKVLVVIFECSASCCLEALYENTSNT